MAWNKKQAEVAAMLKRCAEKSADFKTMSNTILISPAQIWELENTLGPLTDKFEKQSSINWGIFIYTMACDDHPNGRIFLNLLTMIKQQLDGEEATSKDITNAMQFGTIVSTFVSTLRIEVNKLKELKNERPVWIGILDTLLVQSIASIPVVGQISGVALQMILQGGVSALDSMINKGDYGAGLTTAALAGGGATGQVFADKMTNKNFNSNPDQSTGAQFLSKEAGVLPKSDPTKANFLIGFMYDLHENVQEHYREKARKNINQSRDQAFDRQNQIIQLPPRNNMGIVAQNGLTGKDKYINNIDIGVTDARDQLTRKIENDKKTLEGYFTTIGDSLMAVVEFLEKVRDAAVVSAFYDLNENFETRIRAVAGQDPFVKHAMDSNKIRPSPQAYAACVIAGYFFRKMATDTFKRECYDNWQWLGENRGIVKKSAPQVFQNIKGNLTGMVSGTGSINEAFEKAQFCAITQNAARLYVGHIKKAVGQTIQNVFSKSQSKDIDKIIQLKLACTCIVNQCTTRAQANQDLEIDQKYIAVLEKLEYVSSYTKVFIVTDAKKKSLTEFRDDQGNMTYKLRYPKGKGGLTGTASINEVGMVYAFAVIVTQYVDLPRIALGLDSWEKVKENLNKAIQVINQASQA